MVFTFGIAHIFTILRTSVGCLAGFHVCLPYWDWNRLPQIPDPFLDARSSLWDDGRAGNGNIHLGLEIVGQNVISGLVGSGALVDLFSSPATSDDQREDAGAGTLESTPHNGVHATILGDMGTYLSPLDPIFWLHHCNVDRIWASSAKESNNLAPTANLWAKHALRVFYNPLNKQQVAPNAEDTLDAAKYRAIYDKYETRAAGPFAPLVESLRSTMLGPEGLVTNAAGVKRIDVNHLAGREIALGSAQQFQLAVSHEFAGLLEKSAFLPSTRGRSSLRTTDTYLLIRGFLAPRYRLRLSEYF